MMAIFGSDRGHGGGDMVSSSAAKVGLSCVDEISCPVILGRESDQPSVVPSVFRLSPGPHRCPCHQNNWDVQA